MLPTIRCLAALTLTLLVQLGPLAADPPTLADDPDAERARILAEAEALAANQEGLTESERLERYIELQLEYVVNEFPEMATYMGLPGDHGRWSDDSPEAVRRREETSRRALEILEGIDRSELAEGERLNYDLLLDGARSRVEGQRFAGQYLAINQMGGVHQGTTQLLSMMPTFTRAQYDDILSRLAGVDEQVDQTLYWLREGLEAGVTPPKITLRDLPEQVENLLVDDSLESPMLSAFTRFPDTIPADEQERLTARAVEIFRDEVAPAFERLRAFLAEEYVPAARESIAMTALPDGEAWYAYRVRESTTTEMTPEEIHQLGLSEVDRIRAEMDKVIAASGFEGSFEEFTEFLRTDPQFYFTDAEELLAEYRNISKKADLELLDLFGHLPRTPYGVVPIPDYMAKSQTTAYYSPGSYEAGRPGKYYANTYALDTRPKWEMEALTLHEAVPGHHLQIAIAQELDEVPWFRRLGGYTAFTEGWGLYAESLGEEMGFYQDPYSKFGQLTYEMWRAIRLVVDTGMHALGWSRQQAIDYFVANSGKTEHDIVVEIDRYIVWPGQALAYKIGELKLKELRAYAARELGESFDVRAFHDAVLGSGALPLSVLEARMHEWVEEQREPEVAPPDERG